jgi:hypothetical protein
MVRCRGDFLLALGSFSDAQLDGVCFETIYMVDGFRPSDDNRRGTVPSLKKEGALAARAR